MEPILLDLPERIETPRLTMRPPQPGDAPVLLEALTESLTEMRRFLAFLPWVACEQTLESAELYCRNAHVNFTSRKDLPFLLFEKATGRLVGSSGLHRMVWATPKAEVGYWCRNSALGKGYVTEAVNALVGYAFEHLAAVRVELVTDERNARSRKVAERCGFTLEGILHDERRGPDGELASTCIYAKLRGAA